MTYGHKHSSLLWYGTNYRCKKFYGTGPRYLSQLSFTKLVTKFLQTLQERIALLQNCTGLLKLACIVKALLHKKYFKIIVRNLVNSAPSEVLITTDYDTHIKHWAGILQTSYENLKLKIKYIYPNFLTIFTLLEPGDGLKPLNIGSRVKRSTTVLSPLVLAVTYLKTS